MSAGEGGALRISENNQCIQTVAHPASVRMDRGCMQGERRHRPLVPSNVKLARVFTRDQSRYAAEAEIQQFNEDVEGSSNSAADPWETSPKGDSPGRERGGEREGTICFLLQMIKEMNGNVSAYQWSAAAMQWVNVGTVVDLAGSGGRNNLAWRQRSSDYVFNIDIEDSKPPLKLPYDLEQNHYEAARKFIEDNELPLTYLDQVANFIIQNTRGPSVRRGSAQGTDPWGSEARYRPGEMDGKGISLNPPDLEQLNASVTPLEKGNGKGIDITGMELLVKAATRWGGEKRLPATGLITTSPRFFEEPATFLVSPEQNLFPNLI
ncbi:unnamed protein product [Alternaria alternata]